MRKALGDGLAWRARSRHAADMDAYDMIAGFAAAWNTDDDAERLRLLTAACLPEAVFAAPQGETAGTAAMSESIGQFRHAFPAASVRFGDPDVHGQFARVAWATRWNDGRPDLTGEDFALLAADGRIRLLVSFDATAARPGR